MLIAFLNIDEVIKIIREEDKPKPALIKKFKITDFQAEAILNLRLRQLAKLEEMKIKAEQKELNTERKKIEQILDSSARLKTLIKKEIKDDAKQFGDKRRTVFKEREDARAFSETELLSTEPVTVVLSERGSVSYTHLRAHETDS